ncbi:hypothetical protein H0H93_000729 [Arthromyces matolae]|nr:hypothetical protein H0H93_000729 [Arthromyces matolae]
MRIEEWEESGVEDLESKVDSLKGFGFPRWLVQECWEQIDSEVRWIHLFLEEEGEDSPLYTVIKEHETDIDRVKRKLSEHAPRPGVPPLTPDVEEQDSTIIDHGPNNRIHGAHGRPFEPRSHSPSPSKSSDDIPPQRQLSSSINALHTKARRERIKQWARDEVKPLKNQMWILYTTAFPNWLVDDYNYQISHALSLITLFEQEERTYLGETKEHDVYKYLDVMETHKAALTEVRESALQVQRKKFQTTHLRHMLPRMKKGGDWRMVVKHFVNKVKQLHAYDHRVDDQLDAGFQVYKAMAELNKEDQNPELLAFHAFLCDQENELKKAKERFQAGQHGHGPTITQSR